MTTSHRGRLVAPDLDDRTWDDLVTEARALIPTYAPQWTDHNPSGVGMTLIELFAWMVESLIYRLNRVPEKNYIEFLNLLGVTHDPPTPARAFLTFTAQPGGPVVVPTGTQAQTVETEAEAPVIFETDEDTVILPTSMTKAVQIGKFKYTNLSPRLTEPPALGEDLTVAVGSAVQICFGFTAATADEIRLLVELTKPVLVDPPPGGPQATLEWLYSTGTTNPGSWNTIPSVVDDTDGFQHNGSVGLTVPAGWTAQNPADWNVSPDLSTDAITDSLFWVGLRVSNLHTDTITVGVHHILFNAASAHNALTIAAPEPLGTSDATPYQVFPLANQPMFKQLGTDRPYDHLVVDVGGTTWSHVEDLPAGPADVYRLDPVAGEVSFGSYQPANLEGNGSIPADGGAISAVSYRYVAGGADGNVGAGTINVVRTPVAGILAVQNVVAAFGGSDEEAIEDTKRRAPEVLRNRYRAVTAEDYDYLAREATTDVAIAKTLEPRYHVEDNGAAWTEGDPWTFAAIDRSPGNVTVIVVPRTTADDSRPEPSIDLLREVQRYLDRRRDLTSRLQVAGPRYLPIRVVADVVVWQQAIDGGLIDSTADVTADTEDKIRAFLHPVFGGATGDGWQVGQHVFISELFAAIMPPEDIGYISTVTVEAEIPAYHFPPLGPGGLFDPNERPIALGAPGASVRLSDYELVCFGSHSVTTTATV